MRKEKKNMELIKEMGGCLSISVYPSKELAQIFRKQGKDISRDIEIKITRVFDYGDMSGIVRFYDSFFSYSGIRIGCKMSVGDIQVK
jgi:hypothetical protein